MQRPIGWICDAFCGSGQSMPSGNGMRLRWEILPLRLVFAGILVLASETMTGCKGFFVYPGSITTTSGTSNTTTTLFDLAGRRIAAMPAGCMTRVAP